MSLSRLLEVYLSTQMREGSDSILVDHQPDQAVSACWLAVCGMGMGMWARALSLIRHHHPPTWAL